MKKISIFILIIAISFFKPNFVTAQINVNDSLALVALYNSTDGPHWKNNYNWLTDNPVVTWYGVRARQRNTRVFKLTLNGNYLSGNIPVEIGNLVFLTELNLNNNKLTGSIPVEISQLANLVSLSLNRNELSGSIPKDIVNFHAANIDLSYNKLTGTIPKEWAILTNLFLNISHNQLTGSIPEELGVLEYLGYLNVSHNQLTGSIPKELGNCTNLQSLNLDHNQLTGSIPKELANISYLAFLSLDHNQLTGSIPKQLGKFKNIYSLRLNNNQLSGNIPPELSNLESLDHLYLGNNQLSGNIPLQLDSLYNLKILDLRHNNLKGPIPSGLSNLKNLDNLNLSDNILTGNVPYTFNKLKRLRLLHINDNMLSGKVPSFFINLPALKDLALKHNHYTFDGFETLAQHDFDTFKYDSQANIKLSQNTNQFSVYAGGTLSNNTYKWYKDGNLVSTITGDSTFTPSSPGNYNVIVTNSVATQLTLYSDTVNYSSGDNSIASKMNYNSFISLYPNPTKTNATLSFNADGKYVITIANVSGKILQTKTGVAIKGSNTIQLDVSQYASGIYLVTITDEKNKKQTVRLNKE